MKRHLIVTATVLLGLAGAIRPATALDQAATDKLVKEIDYRQHNSGDYGALVYLERKERNKNDINYEALVYRRGANSKLVILFQKPKEEAGKGYLRIDKNLFTYDPTVGKWQRTTERERIAGTDSRRNDFDESRFSEEFTAEWVADEKLGKFDVHHLRLKQKPDIDVAFPIVEMWVDAGTSNILKQQEFALSGKLMRTSYYPKWKKLMSESKGDFVYIPEEILIKDEVEVGNSTHMLTLKTDLRALDDSIFTKAWLEARSR